MTTKVKAKSVSQMRREEKLRKEKLKLEKLNKTQAKANSFKPNQQPTADIGKGLQEIQKRMVEGNFNKPKLGLTVVERFIANVEELDNTLTSILSNMDTFRGMRASLKWDQFKVHLSEADRNAIEEKIIKLEEDNEHYRSSFVDAINTVNENLEVIKGQPVVNEKLELFITSSNAIAFQHFGTWSEAVTAPFFDLQDMIEALPTGEEA